jgi:hypothetical protein
MKAKRINLRIRPRTRPRTSEEIVDDWIDQHSGFVDSIRKSNPGLSRMEVDLLAAEKIASFSRYDARDDSLLKLFDRVLLDVVRSSEEYKAMCILASLFRQIEFIGGPTKGQTAGGGRWIVRKWDEFS